MNKQRRLGRVACAAVVAGIIGCLSLTVAKPAAAERGGNGGNPYWYGQGQGGNKWQGQGNNQWRGQTNNQWRGQANNQWRGQGTRQRRS